MSSPLLYAACAVLLVLGIAHSLLGELWLLAPMPRFQGAAAFANDRLPKRTLRVTWHIATLLGYGDALVLFRYAQRGDGDPFVVRVIAASLAVCGALVLLGTRARHPGWTGFFVAAGLCWIAAP